MSVLKVLKFERKRKMLRKLMLYGLLCMASAISYWIGAEAIPGEMGAVSITMIGTAFTRALNGLKEQK